MFQAIRWTARVLSILLVLFFGFMIFSHFFGGLEAPPDVATLLPMIVMLAGLVIGWRWELAGGAIVILGFAISAGQNPQIVKAWPYALCLLAGLLYLASVIARRKSTQMSAQTPISD